MRELVTDGFAGGGGVSCGIKRATGCSPDVAMNHDDDAISMHTINHPETRHYLKDIWEVDPREATGGQPVGLSWWSPDCTHFSVARGGVPVEKNIRGLAWVKLRWAATVKPRVQILENVKEFQTWGPLLLDGRPDPKQKGRTFRSFVNALKRQGYAVEWRVLRASDYGAPTKRDRFIMISRRDGKPIVWPKPTHGDLKSLEVQAGRLKPWRTAAEIIDWSIPTKSIFGRTKPLAENTMRRIALGTIKYLIEDPNPYIAPIVPETEDNSELVAAFLSQYYTSDTTRGQRIDEPILTIPTSNRFALVTAYMTKFRGTNLGSSANEPLHTITAGGLHHGVVEAFLIAYYGSSIGQSLNEPVNTIVTKDRFALVTVHGTLYRIVDIRMRMLQAHELYAGQGFDTDYIYTHGHDGRKFSKSVQVDKCGNSVPPDLVAAIVSANCPELCANERTESA
jgi:DNA (cytosine-5)-methyltransferase 1